VADLNADGVPDLAVAADAGVNVLLGNGDGSFQNAPTYAVGSQPTSVAVGDFNGDGIPDLAVANEGPASTTVSVLLGNGDGTFQTAVSYATGTEPVSVVVGDFNGDGIPDLAVANYSSNDFSVLLGNGDGTFQAARNFNGGPHPVSVAVGDFNGDGIQDLAIADAGNASGGGVGVSVFLGNGDGSFQFAGAFDAGSSPSSLAVGDFNGDGLLDLAVANDSYFNGTVSVLLGNGDGSFAAARTFAAGSMPRSVAVGDFNGDGLLDLAVANYFGGTVSVLLGNGDGSFEPAHTYAAGFGADSVAVGDVNGDGIQDLAVAAGGNTVSVLLGNGDGSFQTTNVRYVVGSVPRSVAVGDFNGDGSPDLAVANQFSNDVSVLLNDGNWGGPARASSPDRPRREPGAALAVAASPAAVPGDLVAADLSARLSAVWPAPGEPATQRLAPAEAVPPPPVTIARHAADWVFAAPARAGEPAPWSDGLPAADPDGLAWTRYEP
jgi:hypothetical protein